MEEPHLLAAELERLKAQNFTAFKIGWGPFGRQSDRTDEAIVAAARETVGPDALLMVDAGASDAFWPNGLAWARRTADMLSAHGVEWFEEPLNPDLLADHAELRRVSPVPRRQSFMPWFEARAVDIVQPDATKVGGLTEQRRIAWAAAEAGIRFVGHGWNTAIGLAADLQMASALPHTDLVEYCTGSPYIDDLTVNGFSLDSEGNLPVPDDPGLGIALDPDAVLRLTGSKKLLNG
jgi:L-alanine-DL-glutamate epimerase-like enolase superfamily enzyme